MDETYRSEDIIKKIRYDAQGLVPAIVQDLSDGTVLMMAWMDAEALARSVSSGETWFWSRSRQEYWHKGETSGNTQHIVEIRIDCDFDAILVQVEPEGPACHTGNRSCFFRIMQDEDARTGSRERDGERAGEL